MRVGCHPVVSAFALAAAVLLMQAGCNRGGSSVAEEAGTAVSASPGEAGSPGISARGFSEPGSRSHPQGGTGLGGGLGLTGTFPSGTATHSAGAAGSP